VCLASISGRITIDTSPELRICLLERLHEPDCRILTLDFSQVVYIDTSALAVLLELLKTARELDKKFCLTGLGANPHYLLEATQLMHLFEVVPEERLQ
jgi:anti-sigma B factor antagonist